MEDMFHIQAKDKLCGEDWLKCFATKILNLKYENTDVADVGSYFKVRKDNINILTLMEDLWLWDSDKV
jgi:hypothetical protein